MGPAPMESPGYFPADRCWRRVGFQSCRRWVATAGIGLCDEHLEELRN